jgi:AbrB family looped-hinge helix DNA binding protein
MPLTNGSCQVSLPLMSEVHIDKFGRVVIPKPLREQLGLIPGTALSIEAAEDHLILAPKRERPMVERREGVVVYRGAAAGDLDDAVDVHRGRRLRDVAGSDLQ